MDREENKDILTRIADALNRLAPLPAGPSPDDMNNDAPAYRWTGRTLEALPLIEAVPLDLLTGIDPQKEALLLNGRRLAMGHGAHDILMWGARGSGKSALVKSSTVALQQAGLQVKLIEATTAPLDSLPALFATLAKTSVASIVFIDDLGFDQNGEAARHLRSMLDGGVVARPHNVRLYVTSNRRHILPRNIDEQSSAINPRDGVDDQLALADRFGLSLGFHACDQEQYLAMVSAYARHLGVSFDPQDALTWSTQRGARSGRVAWHYATELAGRAGKPL
jgi:uncharacterized protein